MFLKIPGSTRFSLKRGAGPITNQLLQIMKVMAILIFVAVLQVSAKGFSQGITLSEKNVSLEKLFKKIKKQSGYSFLYTQEMLRNTSKLDIEVRNASLQQVLEECLKGQPLTYSIMSNTIIIKPKPVKEQQVSLREVKRPLM